MTDRTPAEQAILSFLATRSIFSSLPAATLEQLVRQGRSKRFARGEAIYHRGDPGESLMLVLSGRVKIANVTANAREVVLNFLGPGDFNGEIAVLDGRERSANAVALEDTETFILYRRDILPVLMENSETLLDVVRVLCEKLRAASAIVEANALEMTGRLAAGVLRLAEQHGRKTKDGVVIDLTLSQRDLGNFVGLSRENVSRQFAKLKDAGIVDMSDAQIVVSDMARLAEMADEDR